MNQQFRDRLIQEAGFHLRPSIENTVPGIDWHSANWGYDQCVDRLIELVVQECIAAAEQAQADCYVVNNIKTRFGVER
jgi:hypothetical protein